MHFYGIFKHSLEFHFDLSNLSVCQFYILLNKILKIYFKIKQNTIKF